MDERFQLFHYALACTGVYIFSQTKWDSKFKFAHQIFNYFNATLIFIFTTGFIIVERDVIAWIEGVCIWITGVIVYMSVVVTLLFRKNFREFLDEMAFRDATLDMPFVAYVMKSPCEGTLKKLQELVTESQAKVFKYSRLMLKVYLCAVLSTAGLYICDAVFQMVVTDDENMRLLAFDMWFPWKLDNWNIYIATFIFHAYAGFFCAMVYPSVQSTIVFLIGQIIRHLMILRFVLLHLDDLIVELTKERDARWQTNCTSVLTQCIVQYVKIKRFSNRLNVICRPFYLALILNAIVLVCVCSVKIAISNKLSPELIKYYLHEFFFILMVLLFCFLGQLIQNECEKLEWAVTEKWYIFDRRHKKNVLIFSMALNQGIPIYIFGTITLSLPTFTWFIKTGMSFFTLVMSVLED